MNARKSFGSSTWPDQRCDDLARLRPALAHPRLESVPALGSVVGVSGLVVLAADDERRRLRVVAECAWPRLVESLHADVVIRMSGVPVERRRHDPRGTTARDDERAIRRLLGVRLLHVGDRAVRANTDGVGGDRVPAARLHRAGFAAFDALRLRVAVDAPPACDDRVGEAREVLENVKLRLVRETQARTEIRSQRRDARASCSTSGEPGALRGARAPRRGSSALSPIAEKEVAVEALEVAVDLFVAHDRFDAVDGGACGSRAAFRAPSGPWTCSST